MKPISFSCQTTLPFRAEEIAGRILDLSNWPDFQGYGPIPGIKLAEFELRTPDVVGSRIRVTNLDGSNHVEEIMEWQPDRRVRLEMQGFSPPLSRLATRFEETWEFESIAEETRVTRSFQMHANSFPAKLLLRCVAFFLKKAALRHLNAMR